MGKRYSKEIKTEVLGKIRAGTKVSDVAELYGIKECTVRSWLRASVEAPNVSLEIGRLRRENEALYRLVGQLTFESSRRKKN